MDNPKHVLMSEYAVITDGSIWPSSEKRRKRCFAPILPH